MKLYQQERYRNKKEQINAKNKEWYDQNREKRIESTSNYKANRLKTDPLFRLLCNVRTRVRNSLKTKNFKKNGRSFDLVGCTIEELCLYLESKFKGGMTWENYGEWHIDHKMPLSSAKTEEELYALCHYTNLQPLWAQENYIKSNKVA
jgi:hypothetical protein